MKDICEEFYNYVFSFYNDSDGIYPISGLTKDMIINATDKYLTSKNCSWGDGDSVDRERVRDIILADNNLVWGV
tara:strand:+ start:277 stop:498 length:222 start_codon:yes stop_codon:yes gene_type:complete